MSTSIAVRRESTCRVLVTFPLENYTIGWEARLCCHGLQGEEAYDQEMAYGGADHRGVEGRPSEHQRPGPVPEAQYLGCDVL